LQPSQSAGFSWENPTEKHLVCIEFEKRFGTKTTLKKIMQIYSFDKLKVKQFKINLVDSSTEIMNIEILIEGTSKVIQLQEMQEN